MSPSAVQISYDGLTEDQVQAEQAWLEGYAKDTDSLNWFRWGGRWDKDAFFQYGNLPRCYGKEAIGQFYEQFTQTLESMHHIHTRSSFNLPLGLIYTTWAVSYKIKDDPKGRTIQVPALSVFHKRLGEDVAAGCEIYVDIGPVAAVIQEVLEQKVVE
ncbi:unnamed protein product [Rhizoctonia solani]|uniref:SnoaL-like domain-containing protein n=1 Tax=Rhizoctonia solani TaxID=456999 RepID=A0A8H3GVG3_9AGAM|nr:unnamed protein product [Rhizoctonia solani]